MASAGRRIAREDGFSLIELIVAALILSVGLLALVSGLDHSRDLVSRGEKVKTATHQAEQAIERVLALRYDRLALSSMPAGSTDQAHPGYYVSGPNYQWDQGSTGPRWEALEVDPANGQVVGSYAWEDSDSRLNGQVHQFVTRTGDRCTAAGCPAGVQSAKRITVAVTVEGPDALPEPVVLSTLMIDPAATG
jgi:prepilin-type N-terminal cleavage/methylation domain-containing protein